MPSAAIPFTDANGNDCELVLIHGEPPTVLHPDCDGRAEVDEWEELFCCSKCGLESPLGMEWVRKMTDQHMRPTHAPKPVPTVSYVQHYDFDESDLPF